MKPLAFALAAGAVLLAAAPAHAQDEWIAQVRLQLREAGRTFESGGFQLAQRTDTGSLRDDTSVRLTLHLDAGAEYAIMGVCDEDCNDLDLKLFDADGDRVDEDMEDDAFPIVQVRPARSGRYTVQILMASCTAEPCRYGLGVFGR